MSKCVHRYFHVAGTEDPIVPVCSQCGADLMVLYQEAAQQLAQVTDERDTVAKDLRLRQEEARSWERLAQERWQQLAQAREEVRIAIHERQTARLDYTGAEGRCQTLAHHNIRLEQQNAAMRALLMLARGLIINDSNPAAVSMWVSKHDAFLAQHKEPDA